jgi:hypothetical protein
MHRYYPSFPFINLVWFIPFVGRQRLEFSVRFVVMGFAYFINSNIAAGIWIFHLLSKFEKEALYSMGIKSDQKTIFGVADSPLLGYQGVGALIAMVLYGLWTGRAHLKNVWLKAIGRAPHIDDSDEVMSYRGATIGSLGGMAVMAAWLWFILWMIFHMAYRHGGINLNSWFFKSGVH